MWKDIDRSQSMFVDFVSYPYDPPPDTTGIIALIQYSSTASWAVPEKKKIGVCFSHITSLPVTGKLTATSSGEKGSGCRSEK